MTAPDFHDHDAAHRGDPHLEAMLDASARAYRAERPGLADRTFNASLTEIPGFAPAVLAFPRLRRLAMPAMAAAVLVVCSVAVLIFASGRVGGGSVRTVRSAELAPSGGGESLLVALIDEDAALRSTEGGDGFDASAVVLTTGRSVDDLTVELEELLDAGGRK